MHDSVGLYPNLNPPEHALVRCVDEKNQCQALERTPVGAANGAEGIPTTTRATSPPRFAALDVANGTVLPQQAQAFVIRNSWRS